MWEKTFEARMADWIAIRDNLSLSDHDYLASINQWWHGARWVPYNLHWDDRNTWPTPWELLADDAHCSLSRGLGIIYTIALSGRDLTATLIETESDNLVLVKPGKYALNYQPDSIVNIELPSIVATHHQISIEEIKQKLS